MAATNGLAENPGLLPEDPALLRARLAEVEARYAQSQVQFRELRTWYDKLKRHHRELLWSEAVLTREGLEEAMPGPPIADADRANGHIGGGFVSSRVEINQFLGDDAAVLARSSGENSHRHAVEQASRRWRGDDAMIQHERRELLISTQLGTFCVRARS